MVLRHISFISACIWTIAFLTTLDSSHAQVLRQYECEEGPETTLTQEDCFGLENRTIGCYHDPYRQEWRPCSQQCNKALYSETRGRRCRDYCRDYVAALCIVKPPFRPTASMATTKITNTSSKSPLPITLEKPIMSQNETLMHPAHLTTTLSKPDDGVKIKVSVRSKSSESLDEAKGEFPVSLQALSVCGAVALPLILMGLVVGRKLCRQRRLCRHQTSDRNEIILQEEGQN